MRQRAIVVTLTCRGLPRRFTAGRRHAPGCPGQITAPLWRARGRVLFDESDQTYLSKPCSMWELASRDVDSCLEILRAHEKALAEETRSRPKSARSPRSWPEVFQLRSRANALRAGPDSRYGARPTAPRGKDKHHGGKRLAYGWRRCQAVVGICEGCRTLTFVPAAYARKVGRPAITHPRCKVQRRQIKVSGGLPPETARNFDWAVRHYLGGETLKAIGEEYHCKDNVVAEGVRTVLELLPPVELVGLRWQKYVIALATESGRPLTEWSMIESRLDQFREQCGTWGAYQRHLRRGEEPCPDCAVAGRAQARTYREASTYLGAICGHPVSKVGVDRCTDCSRVQRAARCGTITGYRKHKRLREPPCESCKKALAESNQRARAKKARSG